MTKAHLIALFLLFTPLFSIAADCPFPANEDHLTIGRVMRNFGRVMYADGICIDAQTPWKREQIKDSEITEAIEKLDEVIACAEAVLKSPTGDLLPSKLNLIKDEAAKQEIIDDYIYFMTDFKDAVIDYRKIFKKILTQKPAERSFDEANAKRLEVNTLVDRAHRKI